MLYREGGSNDVIVGKIKGFVVTLSLQSTILNGQNVLADIAFGRFALNFKNI